MKKIVIGAIAIFLSLVLFAVMIIGISVFGFILPNYVAAAQFNEEAAKIESQISEMQEENEIVINLDVMMARRKISLTELSEKVGITLANLSILKTGKAKAVKLSTMDAICRELQCQPGDLFEFVEDDDPWKR